MTEKLTIWGREFELRVTFDCFDNEEVLPIQEQALEAFLKAPTDIYLPRTTEIRSAALFCDYRFDEEHGIAIVFENEKFIEIGTQDIVL